MPLCPLHTGHEFCPPMAYPLLTLLDRMRSRVYETVERPSVCPSHQSHAAAAGLLLWARRHRSIAARPAFGSKCDVTLSAEHLHSYATERRSKPSVAVGQMVDEAVTGLR